MRNSFDSPTFEVEILGEPASKANSRRAVIIAGKPRYIKSKKALAYAKQFVLQCPSREELFDEDVIVFMRIYYATRRPDLDESLILDLLQGRAYKNDRQVKAKVIFHDLDRGNPRAHIIVRPFSEQDSGISPI